MFKAIVLDIWQNNYKKLDENNLRIRSELERLKQERQKIFDLHRKGEYTEDEFIEQKNIINLQIYQKNQLFEDNKIEEFDMEEALDYCFRFVRETSKTWIRLKDESPMNLLRFQKQIFPGKITFDGEKFGTDSLSLIYKIDQGIGSDKSQLVCLSGFEPELRVPQTLVLTITL